MGILVVTHAERQFDMTLAANDMDPNIVEVSRNHIEIYVDSGVRRGR